MVFLSFLHVPAVPNRDHVFHVRFPDNWKQSDLIHHFRKYGSIFIRWINNNSAFVSLNNRENASILLQTIGRTPNVKIVSFETHQKAQQKLEEVSFIDISPKKLEWVQTNLLLISVET